MMEMIDARLGTASGGSIGGSTVSREEAIVAAVGEEQSSNSRIGGGSSPEVSSYPDGGAELELGLGLSLGGSAASRVAVKGPRILTAKDLPLVGSSRGLNSSPSTASSSSSSSRGGVAGGGNFHGFSSAGTKRAADSVASSAGVSSQVVGWPPVRAYRMNSLSNQAKSLATGEFNKSKAFCDEIGHGRGSLFVKVNMDGIGIGRKVDLSAHTGYESLAQTLDEMFTIPSKRVDTQSSNREDCCLISRAKRTSKLLDGLSDFVLTYEDKDGDWMLVGDVPWGLFLRSVKRLRIMKSSDANGLNT